MTRARSIRLVAIFDLLESLRSRKAFVLLLLYLLGSAGGGAFFVRGLNTLQDKLSEQAGSTVTMTTLMESPMMKSAVEQLAGDTELAAAILAIPPMALLYGLLAPYFVPLLVLFTASDAISGDLSSGAARFSLFRTDRLSWAVGKLLGQAALMAVGVLVGALGWWAVGAIWLNGMELGTTAWWLLRMSGLVTVYCFAYLGMAMCASQLVRTRIRAWLLALVLMAVAKFAGAIVMIPALQDKSPGFFKALSKIFPAGHDLPLWHPGLWERGSAAVGLVAIGLAFFGLGYLRFARRDA